MMRSTTTDANVIPKANGYVNGEIIEVYALTQYEFDAARNLATPTTNMSRLDFSAFAIITEEADYYFTASKPRKKSRN